MSKQFYRLLTQNLKYKIFRLSYDAYNTHHEQLKSIYHQAGWDWK